MFGGKKKNSAFISDEEPSFNVRYVGSTETFTAVGAGCTSRYVQKLWDNAPSERHLKRVVVKMGLGGIWVRGLSPDTKVKVAQTAKGGEVDNTVADGSKGQGENNIYNRNKEPHSQGIESNRRETGNTNVRFFKMEDVSYCAADTSANDRIFCWISRRNPQHSSDGHADPTITFPGPLELHAVLCSTSNKAQTMAAVMSRAFQLAYKDWCAERQRESRKKQQTKVATVLDIGNHPVSSNSGRSADRSNSNSSTNSDSSSEVTTTQGPSKNGSVLTSHRSQNHRQCESHLFEEDDKMTFSFSILELSDDGNSRQNMSTSASSSSISSSASQHSFESSRSSPQRW